jgi:hypothetical protein
MAKEPSASAAQSVGEMRECPFCKEEIKAGAIKCKHCGSRVSAEGPAHGGTCPYCKEDIKPDAIKCKHCGSYVGPEQGALGPYASEGCSDCGDRAVAMQAIGTAPGFESACSQSCWLQCISSPPPGVPGGDPFLGSLGRDPFLCWWMCGLRCGEPRDPRDWPPRRI